jgi:hypothetical protein
MPESTKEFSGEELDRAVAGRVMGNTLPEVWSDPTVGPSHGDPGGYRIGVRPYSSSIEAAMQVVEKMRELGWRISIMNNVGCEKSDLEWSVDFNGHRIVNRLAAELPEAICRASLKAIGVSK